MKNLPEKIYLNLNMTPQEVRETKEQDFHEATKTWEITWSEERLSEHDPEYIRKDAFIEKAEKYLTEKFIKDVSVLAGGVVNINFSAAIKNFVKYMKEE